MPVSSYAPEMLELFKRASRETILLQIGDKTKATYMRFRFHNLRKEMRKEQHSLTSIANAVQFSITPEFDLKCFPADDQYLSYLHAAGVRIEAPTTPSAEPMHPAERGDAEEALTSFLTKGDKEDG